jgi:hypothetical protein
MMGRPHQRQKDEAVPIVSPLSPQAMVWAFGVAVFFRLFNGGQDQQHKTWCSASQT